MSNHYQRSDWTFRLTTSTLFQIYKLQPVLQGPSQLTWSWPITEKLPEPCPSVWTH